MNKIYLGLNAEPLDDIFMDDFWGIGLIRSEYLCRYIGKYITQKDCIEYIKNYLISICQVVGINKPIWYRFTDLTADEVSTLEGCDHQFLEKHYHVGIKGTRRHIKYLDTFDNEIDIVKFINNKYTNFGVLLPYVKDVKEYVIIKNRLRDKGYKGKIGVVFEIPSAIYTIEDFIKQGIDIVVVGLNDLTALMLGTYRTSEFHSLSNEIMIRIVKDIKKKCYKYNLDVLVAGYLNEEDIEKYSKTDIDGIIVNYVNLDQVSNKYSKLKYLDMVTRIKEQTRISIKNIKES